MQDIIDKAEEGKKIAKHRHEFVLNYLDEFFSEWNFLI